jgi:hypothetical protein
VGFPELPPLRLKEEDMRGTSPWAFKPERKKNRKGALLGDFDWREILHPASAYSHPNDIVRDTDLTLNEKRAILASWASDASAVVSNPALRQAPSSDRPVTFDEIMEALRSLDQLTLADPVPAKKTVKTHSPWRWPPDLPLAR